MPLLLGPCLSGARSGRSGGLYARHSVGHAWLIDPIARTIDVFRLESGRWSLLGSFAEKDKAKVEPFQEIEINLGDLWLESLQPQTDIDGS
jgi:hypothetical protein